jgi:septum formation protein
LSKLLLASSSPYRRQLLDKLGLAYTWQSPDIDEQPKPNEPPADLVIRLAEQKALALAVRYPGYLIIGSDQVALLDGQILGKPGNFMKAREQLSAASGRKLTFLTGLCLLNSASMKSQIRCEPYEVTFRNLTAAQIDFYLNREQPFDCAGSFKAEGLGISLFERLKGDDPNILIGLPVIALIDMLNNEGVSVLGSRNDSLPPE